jgi:hypothetical protein
MPMSIHALNMFRAVTAMQDSTATPIHDYKYDILLVQTEMFLQKMFSNNFCSNEDAVSLS